MNSITMPVGGVKAVTDVFDAGLANIKALAEQ